MPVSNMLTSAVVSEFFRQSVIDEEKFVAVSPDPHEEIIRFDISVNEVLVVYELDTADHLVSQHQHRLHGEPPGAKVEEVLQGGAKQIHDEDVVVTFGTIPADVRDANTALKILIFQLSSAMHK